MPASTTAAAAERAALTCRPHAGRGWRAGPKHTTARSLTCGRQAHDTIGSCTAISERRVGRLFSTCRRRRLRVGTIRRRVYTCGGIRSDGATHESGSQYAAESRYDRVHVAPCHWCESHECRTLLLVPNARGGAPSALAHALRPRRRNRGGRGVCSPLSRVQ